MSMLSRLVATITRRKVSRAEVFDLARQERFTGSVTFNFRGGRAVSVATGPPYQTDLVEEEDSVSHTVALKVRQDP